MLITINQACKKYRIPLAVLEDWAAVFLPY